MLMNKCWRPKTFVTHPKTTNKAYFDINKILEETGGKTILDFNPFSTIDFKYDDFTISDKSNYVWKRFLDFVQDNKANQRIDRIVKKHQILSMLYNTDKNKPKSASVASDIIRDMGQTRFKEEVNSKFEQNKEFILENYNIFKAWFIKNILMPKWK